MSNFSNYQWLCERAILALRNDDVNNINCRIQDSFRDDHNEQIDRFRSDQDEVVHYPIEFLNSPELPGFPPHELRLKKVLSSYYLGTWIYINFAMEQDW